MRLPAHHKRWLLLLALAAVALVLSVPAGAQVRRGAEVTSCGGGEGISLGYRASDAIAQGPIGPMAEGGGTRAYDGFFLVLPSINVPVEGALFASLTESETVVLRWTVGSLSEISGFNVYRGTAEDGPFVCVNEEMLPAESPGSFEDTTVWPETTFWYELRAVLIDGTEDVVQGSPVMATTGGTLTLRLYAARPNPFSEGTSLRFDVPDRAGFVSLRVFNLRGQEIRHLVDRATERGRYELVWDGRDSAGNATASGVYFVRLDAGGRSLSQKVMVLR